MKNMGYALTMITLFVFLGACASTEVATTVNGQASGRGTQESRTSTRGMQAAADLVACAMMPAEQPAPCEEVARQVRVAPSALRVADASALDQVSEWIETTELHDGTPLSLRTNLNRWLDLSGTALREALNARNRLRTGSNDEALVAQALQAHDGETALQGCVAEARGLAPEVEASSLLVLSHRLQTASSAPVAVRDSAMNGLVEMLPPEALPPATSPSDARATRSTHGGDGGRALLASAHRWLARRSSELAPQVQAPALRAAVQSLRTGE